MSIGTPVPETVLCHRTSVKAATQEDDGIDNLKDVVFCVCQTD